MITEFIELHNQRKATLRAQLLESFPDDYKTLVTRVIEQLALEADYPVYPDANRIYEIDDGDYQGTLVYVIGCTGYQPSQYWYTVVDYGSCSGCDTLEALRENKECHKDPTYIDGLMTLALHIVQGLKRMDTEP